MVTCERCYLCDGAEVPLLLSFEMREKVLTEVWSVEIVSWRLPRQQLREGLRTCRKNGKEEEEEEEEEGGNKVRQQSRGDTEA